MDCFFLASGTVAVDLPRDCGGRIRGRSSDQNTMNAPQPEFRVIPQFDSGRWKLRLERVPLSTDKQSDNEHNSCEIETAIRKRILVSASQRFRSDAERQLISSAKS